MRFAACWFLCSLAIAAAPASETIVPDRHQNITLANQLDCDQLQKRREAIEQYIPDSERPRYATAAGKLAFLRELLKEKRFDHYNYKLESMGIVLGDVFVQKLHFEWVIVTDEQGRDPAVRLPGTSIIIYPVTMISKRIERGETVDVFELFNGVADKVADLKKDGA